MSNNLYEQAIAEAKQLREMAEQNAKNKIIEAVTPRIKALIEAQIMGEQDEMPEEDSDSLDLLMIDDEESKPMPEDELLEPQAPENDMLSGETEIENTSVTVNAQGDVNISVAEGRGNNRTLETNTRTSTLSGKINLTEAFISVGRKAKRMDAMLQGLQFNKLNEKQRTLIKKAYQELLSEALLTKRLLLNEGANAELTTSYSNMLKEIKEMTRRSSAIFRRLFEIDDQDEMRRDEMVQEEEEEGAEGGGESADVDMDAASSALEDLGSALGLDVEVGEEGGDDDSDEEEIDLGEMAHESSHDEGMHESDEEDEMREADEEDEMREADEEDEAVDEVYEIDENVLRREIKRLRNLREAEGVDSAVIDDFGGGEEEDEMFVDVDEDDLLNALGEELGSVPSVQRETRERRSFTTRRLRRANAQLQTENKKLKKQLSEMNLFNAKLLYVNKLMQNRNVSSKQQRAIVEALDNAKTIREAKFLYEGLAKSLTKRTQKKLTESADRRLLSSSSKATRSGSATINEDAVASRWATLAGIRK